jgi:hypothetical protein
MSDCLKDFEYYSLIHNSYVYGEIVGIQEENSYILKNKKDGTEEICESNSIRKITEISQNAIDNGQWEFIKGEDEFLEATIKEQKGLFFIIELTDEDGNSSTKIARQKELRCINYIPIDEFLEDKYANIFFEIPSELSSWIDSEKFKEITDKIKEEISKDNENSELFIVSYPENEDTSLRILCNSEKKDFVKLYLDAAIEGEKKLSSVNRDKENSKKELEDVKKKNKTFFIPQKFVGLIIGKDGINIKNLKNKYGVNIAIDSKKVNENKLSKVIITGDNGDNVEECTKEIDVAQKIYEISEKCSIDIKKRANSLMESYKIKMIYVSNEEKKDDDGNVYKAPNVECIGNEEYIEEFYNNEIKDYDNFDKYSYGNHHNNYNSGSSYRQNNKRYNNNYYGYQNNYKSHKNYNSYNNYY